MKAEEVLKRYAAGERAFLSINLNEANLSGANLSRADLSGANLSVANLSGSNLSGANLSRAKLNVTKLSGANLSGANLSEANLNVANLTLADLSEAELGQASLIRAELSRADLSGAHLSRANISGADLKDAKLRNADLTYANLSRTDFKWATLTAANLMQANLHGADLSSADFSGTDLSNTELRQANLSRTNLSGANLSGANLRWADLSGADLSWADLSNTKLSGANLTGANLNNANLVNASLVHVDLTRANLVGVDWAGADLSGATLTGAKLYGVPRFGIKTEGICCDWIDLSPNGDQSHIYYLTLEDHESFFHEIPPTVQIVVDAALSQEAHWVLAATYHQIFRKQLAAINPPNIQVSRRRTTLTFEMDSDDQLFLTAYLAIAPFQDAEETQKSTIALMRLIKQMIQSTEKQNHATDLERLQQISAKLDVILEQSVTLKLKETSLRTLEKIKFFQAPTRTLLINSNGQTLNVYSNHMFGKRIVTTESGPDFGLSHSPMPPERPPSLPALRTLIEFVQGFYLIGSI